MTKPSPKIAPMTGAADPAALAILRQYYRQGIPDAPAGDGHRRRRRDLQGSGRGRRAATGRRRDRTRSGRVLPADRRRRKQMMRLVSLGLFLALWQVGAWMVGPHYLPTPAAVGATLAAEARSGALTYQSRHNAGARACRLFARDGRSASALGIALGRMPALDRLLDPWLVILLNTPALVVIILAYIWGGLNEVSALAAITLNKLPNAVVTLREGARALDPALDEMAQVFAFPRLRRWRHVVAAATRALFRGGRARRPGAGVEDRAGGGIARPPQWRRLQDERGLSAVRSPAAARLRPALRRADDRCSRPLCCGRPSGPPAGGGAMAIEITIARKAYRRAGNGERLVFDQFSLRRRRGRDRRAARPVGLRQEQPAAHHRRARPRFFRRGQRRSRNASAWPSRSRACCPGAVSPTISASPRRS